MALGTLKELVIGRIAKRKKLNFFLLCWESYPTKMNSFPTVTPADILKERDQARAAGRIAHSANSSGEFFARLDCSCYTCRDVLDPTGTEDAKAQNAELPRLPPPAPPLTRQNALCVSCCTGHSCTVPCNPPFEWTGLSCVTPSASSLPPLTIACPDRQLSNTSSNILSPVSGLRSPRCISEVSSPPPVEESYRREEEILIRRLTHMLTTYDQLDEHIQKQEASSKSHSEMAMFQTWWEEIDTKRDAIQTLLSLLKL